MKELQTQLADLNAMYEETGKKFIKFNEETGENEYKVDLLVKLDPSYKTQLDEAKKYIKQQIGEVEIQLKLAKAQDYEKSLQKALGLDDKTAVDLINKGGAKWIETYAEKINEKYSRQMLTDAYLGINQGDDKHKGQEYLNELKDLMNVYSTLMNDDSVKFGILDDEQADNTTKKLKELIDTIKEYYLAVGGDQDLLDEVLGNTILKEQVDIWAQLTEQMKKYFETWGMGEANAEMFAQTLTDIVQTQIPNTLVNSFVAIGNAMAKAESVGDALKKQFMSFISQILQSLSITCIQAGVNLIAQSGWGGVPLALALFALGGASGIASGFVSAMNDGSSVANKQQEELDRLNSLLSAYKDLEKAIREQEEYYLKKQKELNAWSLKNYVEKAQPVNDMILTPHGNFSTNPNDTIIFFNTAVSHNSLTA